MTKHVQFAVAGGLAAKSIDILHLNRYKAAAPLGIPALAFFTANDFTPTCRRARDQRRKSLNLFRNSTKEITPCPPSLVVPSFAARFLIVVSCWRCWLQQPPALLH